MDFLISNAYAQIGGGSGSTLMSLLPMILIFVVFYFLLIRPQQKRTKQHREMVANIGKGDEVVTSGGFLGACPPAPTEKGDRNTVDRPTYPDWKKL